MTCQFPGLSPLPDGTQVHTPPVVMIAAIGAAAALLVLLYQTRTRWLLAPTDLQIEKEQGWSPGYVTAEQPPRDVACRATTLPPKVRLVVAVVLSYIALLAALTIESQSLSTP